jgi:RNA polymerase sigma-70 factor (ECF subfamily)
MSLTVESVQDVAAAEGAVTTAAARLRAMLDQHFEFIWRQLRRLGLSPDLADDAAQQVFIVASRKLEAIVPGRERSFLLGTAIRVASDTRRASARRREVAGELPTDSIDPAPRADELLDHHRARAMLDDVLAKMPIDSRTVFMLFELEEMTMAEIAELLDLPLGTVASRLRRARAQFEVAIKRRSSHGGLR